MRKLNTNDIIGQKFNKLTVLKYLYNKRTPHPCGKFDICHYYLCKCECGRIKQIERQALIKNRTKSCGCIINETRFKTHHYSRTRLYRIYCMMKDRCYNPNIDNYKWYGAKGIKICDEWKTDPAVFIQWALANGYNDNLTIDRIDSNGDYCPENCRWTTQKQQSRNKCNNNKYKNICLVDWAKIFNISNQALSRYVKLYDWNNAVTHYQQRRIAKRISNERKDS